jgi:hypothetical protein
VISVTRITTFSSPRTPLAVLIEQSQRKALIACAASHHHNRTAACRRRIRAAAWHAGSGRIPFTSCRPDANLSLLTHLMPEISAHTQFIVSRALTSS